MMLDDVATYLAAQSTTLSKLSGTGGNLSRAVMPSTMAPDTIVTLYETAGTGPYDEFSTGSGSTMVYEAPILQVLSRSTSASTARTNAYIVFDLLHGYTGKLPTSTGTVYLSIAALQSPFQADIDDNHRFIYSVNFAVMKER